MWAAPVTTPVLTNAEGRHPVGYRPSVRDVEAQASSFSSRSFVVRDWSSGMPGPFVVASVAFVM